MSNQMPIYIIVTALALVAVIVYLIVQLRARDSTIAELNNLQNQTNCAFGFTEPLLAQREESDDDDDTESSDETIQESETEDSVFDELPPLQVANTPPVDGDVRKIIIA